MGFRETAFGAAPVGLGCKRLLLEDVFPARPQATWSLPSEQRSTPAALAFAMASCTSVEEA